LAAMSGLGQMIVIALQGYDAGGREDQAGEHCGHMAHGKLEV